MAEERAAESWDCFPKFLAASLAACQSWYLCLIVITPPRADHYLAACLHFPSHFQKEIIKAPMLRREVCRCGSWLLPPCESPSAGGSLPRALRGHLPSPTREKEPIAMVICSSPSILRHPPTQSFELVSPIPRTTRYSLSFLQILHLLHASSLSPEFLPRSSA